MFWSPHAVDNDRFAAEARESGDSRSKIREELGCQPGEYMILFVGKFVSLKRPLDLVKALAMLGNGDLEVRGVFVGNGAARVSQKLSRWRWFSACKRMCACS